jgi:hypothetical protein
MASQYSLIDHKNALNQLFPAVRRKNASLVVGSSLNAGFISGSPRYNYGKDSYKIPPEFLEKRKRLREVAANHGVDLRTAALQFSASPDVAAALIVGASSEQQILADYTSMQTRIPAEFWIELKAEKLIEQNAPTPAREHVQSPLARNHAAARTGDGPEDKQRLLSFIPSMTRMKSRKATVSMRYNSRGCPHLRTLMRDSEQRATIHCSYISISIFRWLSIGKSQPCCAYSNCNPSAASSIFILLIALSWLSSMLSS